jgi:hypothetical protein
MYTVDLNNGILKGWYWNGAENPRKNYLYLRIYIILIVIDLMPIST